MRRVRYGVAMSLDGYIAGSKGEADWIEIDPEVDFAALWRQFDTLLMGRATYEAAVARLGKGAIEGMKTYVVSRTLRQEDYPGVTVVAELSRDWMRGLREQNGKDIWLMGGGVLFHSLQEIGEVDAVEVSVVPVLLGGGIPLLPPAAGRTKLKLAEHKVYRSGLVSLVYEVVR
jgi:dihydrofolate reductase